MAVTVLNIVSGIQIREVSDLSKVIKLIPSTSQTTATTRIINGPATGNVELENLVGVSSNIQTQLNDKASKALDNLASVAINTSLLPGTTGSITLGSAAKTFLSGHVRSLTIYNSSDVAKGVISSNVTLPSTVVVGVNYGASADEAVGLSTLNSSTTSGSIQIETGNATDNSGDIIIQTGIGASYRGQIYLNGDQVRRGPSFLNFIEEQLIIAGLNASQTNANIAALSYVAADYKMVMIDYYMIENTTNAVRGGRFTIATNGTDISYTDSSTETAPIGVTLSAVINGAMVEVHYDNDTNVVSAQWDVKRFKS